MAFYIKRNDRRPSLTAQFFQADGVTPLDLSSAASVSMVVRPTGAGIDDAPKFKSSCTVVNSATGQISYTWNSGDTDTAGTFDYEFEITWASGITQTIPADTYFTLVVVDDIG